MNKKLLIALICLSPLAGQAQFGNLINKAKGKVQQRVDNGINKAMDKALDNAEGTISKKNSGGTPASTDAAASADDNEGQKPKGLTSYSKFDFVPGEKVLYAEDFAGDAIGELPLTWNSSGKGEVMTIEGQPGKWVRGYQGNTLLSGSKKSFGENFTIEFDAIFFFDPKVTGYIMPDMKFGIFSSGALDNTDNSFLKNQSQKSSVEFAMHVYNATTGYVKSREGHSETFSSDRAEVPAFMENFNKVMHYSIQVQKTRFRIWVNAIKLFDIPRAVSAKDTMNQLYFNLEGSNYKDNEIGYFVSNIKVATGLPDTRHKLLEEGKFSTTGILFDVQSAVIKPESYGVIKEIAALLKENSTVNIKITGHTSSDGDAKANLELSRQRAASVKALLVKDYGIDETRLQTDGKGATQPVADNKSKEGKVQNRRVEFTKI